MSKAAVKKYLASLDKEELLNTVMELYSARREAKEYLDFLVEPNEADLLEAYKAKACRGFYSGRGYARTLKFTPYRKAVNEFKKYGVEPYYVAELMLYSLEIASVGCEYSGQADGTYRSAQNNTQDMLDYIFTNDLTKKFEDRLEKFLSYGYDYGCSPYSSLREALRVYQRTHGIK